MKSAYHSDPYLLRQDRKHVNADAYYKDLGTGESALCVQCSKCTKELFGAIHLRMNIYSFMCEDCGKFTIAPLCDTAASKREANSRDLWGI